MKLFDVEGYDPDVCPGTFFHSLRAPSKEAIERVGKEVGYVITSVKEVKKGKKPKWPVGTLRRNG
jgi:hypothetical protein